MHTDPRRITLVARQSQNARNFSRSADAPSRIIVMESALVLRYAISGCLSGVSSDVERVILGEASSTDEYLSLLAALPADFIAEVLLFRPDGTAYLSTTGRGAGRVLYGLSATDLDFYLTTHGLVDATRSARCEHAA